MEKNKKTVINTTMAVEDLAKHIYREFAIGMDCVGWSEVSGDASWCDVKYKNGKITHEEFESEYNDDSHLWYLFFGEYFYHSAEVCLSQIRGIDEDNDSIFGFPEVNELLEQLLLDIDINEIGVHQFVSEIIVNFKDFRKSIEDFYSEYTVNVVDSKVA